MQPLIFNPIMVEKVWGGTWLKPESKKLIGESIIFGDDNGLVNNKEGLTWDKEQKIQMLNDIKSPLMLKLLDAQQNLSVQVHPKQGMYSKTEIWYVLDAIKGAEIVYGLKGNFNDFKSALLNGKNIQPFLNKVKIKKGDLVYLPSGIVHALGSGIKVLEIQQNSNVTYRLYDYGRDREIHIEDGLQNIDIQINYNTPAIKRNFKSSEFIIGDNIIKTVTTDTIQEKFDCSYTLLVSLEKEVQLLNNGDFFAIPPFSAALFKSTVCNFTLLNKCPIVRIYVSNITHGSIPSDTIISKKTVSAK